MILFSLALYLLVVALGVVLMWFAYQIHFNHRLSLIRDHERKPVPQADLIARHIALMATVAGIAVLAFAVAVPVYSIRFGSWPAYLAVLGSVVAIWRQLIFVRYYKLRRLATSSAETADQPEPD